MRCALALPFVGLTLAVSVPDVSSTLQNILKNTDGTNKYKYPTDFTRGILPVRDGLHVTMTMAVFNLWHRNLSTATTTTGETCLSTRAFPMVLYPPRQMYG